jgi:hypothetical protein
MTPIRACSTAAHLGFSATYHVEGVCPSCQYSTLELSGYRAAIARLERFFASRPGLMADFDAFERQERDSIPPSDL